MANLNLTLPGTLFSPTSILGVLCHAGHLKELSVSPWPYQSAVARLNRTVDPMSHLGIRLNQLDRRISDSGMQYPAIADAVRELLVARILRPIPDRVARRLVVDAEWSADHASLLHNLGAADRTATVQAGRWLAAATKTALKTSSRTLSASSSGAIA